MDVYDSHENPTLEKMNARTSLLENGEDFEILDKGDIDDEPPPLEDTGGGKAKTKDDSFKITSDTDSESPQSVDEWLDVLGMHHMLKGILFDCDRIHSFRMCYRSLYVDID